MAYTDLTESDLLYWGMAATTETALRLTGLNTQGAVIPFGYGLARGTNDGDLVIPSATGFTFMGIAADTDTIEKRAGYSLDANSNMGWPINYEMSFYRQGLIAVPCDSDCVQGSPVYLIHTASTGQVPGHFRKDANVGAADLVANAVFWKTLAAAGIGLIRLNLP